MQPRITVPAASCRRCRSESVMAMDLGDNLDLSNSDSELNGFWLYAFFIRSLGVFVIILTVFALVLVIIVIIWRREIDRVQQYSGDVSIDLRQDIASAAQSLLCSLAGANH